MAKTTAAKKRTIDQIEDITYDIENLNLAVNYDPNTDNETNLPRKIYKAKTPKPS